MVGKYGVVIYSLWRRKWQPVFLPGESHGQRSLAGYSSWGRKSRIRLSDQINSLLILKYLEKEIMMHVMHTHTAIERTNFSNSSLLNKTLDWSTFPCKCTQFTMCEKKKFKVKICMQGYKALGFTMIIFKGIILAPLTF